MDAVIGAGSVPRSGEPLYEFSQGSQKALVDVAGKPMVQWVLDAISEAEHVDRVVLTGLDENSGLSSRKALAAIGISLCIFSRNLTMLTIARGILGIGSGIFISSSFALITDTVGRYLGIANIASGGGAAIARLLGGALIDPVNRLSGSSTAGYLTLFSFAALLFIFSIIAASKLPPRRPERENLKAGTGQNRKVIKV